MSTKRRMLICGATGFIGRNLVEHFAGNGGYGVVAVHNKRPPFDWPAVEDRKSVV